MNETARQYIDRMTALVTAEGREPLAIMAATADTLDRLVGAATASELRQRPAPDAWSVVEIVTHLADAEIVTGFRIRAILAEPGTAIAAYDQNAWALSGQYGARDPRQSIAQFRAVRDANLRLLESLTPEQWTHHGMHSQRGRETIEQIVRLTAGHDINHLRQIQRIQAPV